MTPKGDISRSQVLAFLIQCEEKNLTRPTSREIASALHREVSHIYTMLMQLEKSGYIRCDRGKSRAVTILPAGFQQIRRQRPSASYIDRQMVDVANIQFRGYIAAGEPISVLPYGDPDDIIQVMRSQLPDNLAIEDCFALRVRGNSMIDDGIYDGDTIILKQAETANYGDTVAVWLDDYECTTLKRYQAVNGQVHLIPRNQTMQPIEVAHPERMRIQGKLVYVLSQ